MTRTDAGLCPECNRPAHLHRLAVVRATCPAYEHGEPVDPRDARIEELMDRLDDLVWSFCDVVENLVNDDPMEWEAYEKAREALTGETK